jgi:hypothetical protein
VPRFLYIEHDNDRRRHRRLPTLSQRVRRPIAASARRPGRAIGLALFLGDLMLRALDLGDDGPGTCHVRAVAVVRRTLSGGQMKHAQQFRHAERHDRERDQDHAHCRLRRRLLLFASDRLCLQVAARRRSLVPALVLALLGGVFLYLFHLVGLLGLGRFGRVTRHHHLLCREQRPATANVSRRCASFWSYRRCRRERWRATWRTRPQCR